MAEPGAQPPAEAEAAPRLHLLTRRRWPLWFGPSLVALVCWAGGAHQPGPLLVYPETHSLLIVWYLVEQALAVGITLAALMAGAALVSGRLLPYRMALQTICDARFLLALAAALVSHAVTQAFVPGQILSLGGPRGLSLSLGALQIAWLAVMTLAVASLLLRVALGYYRVLSTVIPRAWPCFGALVIALVLGELTGQMVSHALFLAFLWPPH